jgi:hypothetical protein
VRHLGAKLLGSERAQLQRRRTARVQPPHAHEANNHVALSEDKSVLQLGPPDSGRLPHLAEHVEHPPVLKQPRRRRRLGAAGGLRVGLRLELQHVSQHLAHHRA